MMLHTMNGFLCAAVGFSLVNLLNRKKEVSLSPMYVTLVAFCFSMTVGVLWEFVEYFCDSFFYLDMQKDTIIYTIGTVKLGAPGDKPLRILGITKTLIYTKDGHAVTVDGGYLDVGLNDTRKDLFVNLIGAIAFSIIGCNFIAGRQSASIAPQLEICYETPEKTEAMQKKLEEADRLTYRQTVSRDAKELFRGRGGREEKVQQEETPLQRKRRSPAPPGGTFTRTR